MFDGHLLLKEYHLSFSQLSCTGFRLHRISSDLLPGVDTVAVRAQGLEFLCSGLWNPHLHLFLDTFTLQLTRARRPPPSTSTCSATRRGPSQMVLMTPSQHKPPSFDATFLKQHSTVNCQNNGGLFLSILWNGGRKSAKIPVKRTKFFQNGGDYAPHYFAPAKMPTTPTLLIR
jgi:hypothetical protein